MPDRRRRALATATLVVATAVAGCAGDDDAASGSEGPAATAATTTAAPTTVSVASTTPGPTEGAAEVGRLVVLAEEFMLADVMALGLRPVASSASVPEVGFQGLGDLDTTGVEVLPMTTLNMERLALVDPDTIVTLQFWVDQIGEDQLQGLADVIAVPDGLTIPDRLAYLGDRLGRTAEAAEVIADLQAAEETAAAAVPDDCTVSVAAIYPGPSPAAFVAGPWELPTSVLATGCALDPDPTVAAPDGNGRVFLSPEQLGILDAPTIVLLQSSTVQGEQDALDEITANPLWTQLPAVQADRVVTFDRLGYAGAAGQIRFLGEFADLFVLTHPRTGGLHRAPIIRSA